MVVWEILKFAMLSGAFYFIKHALPQFLQGFLVLLSRLKELAGAMGMKS